MKFTSILFLFAFAFPMLVDAQRENKYKDHFVMPHENEASSLSIFSESGAQFFLVLNGIAQNNVPTSRIRVEGLPQYNNDVEVVFADGRTPAIRKRIMVADQVAGKAIDMVVKITAGGYESVPVLRFVRSSEVERNYRPQPNECVMSYGKPRQTTTTTTTTVYEQNTPTGPVAMDARSFDEAKHSIQNASFEDTRLSTAKTILGSNYVNTSQVIELCKLFSFENTMVSFAKFAYSRTVDKNNYFKVGEVFSFDSNKRELNDFISKGGR